MPEREHTRAQTNGVVTTQWLASRLEDTDIRVYECTTYLDPPSPDADAPYTVRSGYAEYAQAHVAGAAFLDIQGDLSDPDSPAHLRFKMPAFETLAQAFAAHGIGDDSTVVLYSRANPQWAARVWWMLRSIGFDGAAVLDGGWEKWAAEGRPVESRTTRYARSSLHARPRPELFVDRNAVAAAIGDPETVTINALSRELHSGESARYGRPGRIPGSANVPAQSLLDPASKTLLPDVAVGPLFTALGIDPASKVIVYCGGGIAATLDALVLTRLGYENVAVYDASMSEWARDESLPVEIG